MAGGGEGGGGLTRTQYPAASGGDVARAKTMPIQSSASTGTRGTGLAGGASSWPGWVAVRRRGGGPRAPSADLLDFLCLGVGGGGGGDFTPPPL
jgi:hypothetical protein